MTYLIAIIAGIIGAVAGWYAGDAAVPSLVDSMALLPDIGQIKSMIDPGVAREVAASVGLLIAVWLALRIYAGHRTFRALAWRGLAVILAVVTLTVGTARVGAVVFDQFGMNAGALSVAFEIKLPVTAAMPQRPADVQVELSTDKNQTIAMVSEIARERDVAIVHGTVPILFKTAQREILLSLPGEPVRTFRLRLLASPMKNAEFGPWQGADAADGGPTTSGRNGKTVDEVAIRYRV